MRIGVLSDTHVSSFEHVPKKITDSLSTVDMIIHAGDLTTMAVLNGLKSLGKVKAVQGNMDSAELKSILPVKEILEVGNKRIGITHGWGDPWRIGHRVRKLFDQEQVDVIVYGHSHKAQNEVIEGVILFNPGRAAKSFGLLLIGESIRGQIISSQ